MAKFTFSSAFPLLMRVPECIIGTWAGTGGTRVLLSSVIMTTVFACCSTQRVWSLKRVWLAAWLHSAAAENCEVICAGCEVKENQENKKLGTPFLLFSR